MPLYKYQAVNALGSSVSGLMNSSNETDLEYKLKNIGLFLTKANTVKRNKLKVFSRISIKELILMCIHLEHLDKVGVPIIDSVEDLRDTTNSLAVKNVMSDIHEDLLTGASLSQSMAKHPDVFDKLFLGMVITGENTGSFSKIFEHLAMHYKWLYDINAKIRKALSYPIFMIIVMIGVIAQMMIFVIPKITKFLVDNEFSIPSYTKALIATSNFFVDYWFLVFSVPVVLFFFMKFLKRNFESVSYLIDRLVLQTPILGKIIRKIEMSRFCRFFIMTFQNGVNIIEAMDISTNTIKNSVIRKSILKAKNSVTEGQSLSQAFSKTGQFPTLVIRMFKVSEDANANFEPLKNINYFYDQEIEDSVNRAISLINPIATIMLGGLLMWIIIAVFGPLYAMFSKMNF